MIQACVVSCSAYHNYVPHWAHNEKHITRILLHVHDSDLSVTPTQKDPHPATRGISRDSPVAP